MQITILYKYFRLQSQKEKSHSLLFLLLYTCLQHPAFRITSSWHNHIAYSYINVYPRTSTDAMEANNLTSNHCILSKLFTHLTVKVTQAHESPT